MTHSQKWLLSIALLLLGVSVTGIVNAASGLAIVCPDATKSGQNVSVGCAGEVYKTPTGADIVRTAPTSAPGWGSAGYVYAPFTSLVPGKLYEVCASDVIGGSPNTPSNCGSWTFKTVGAVGIGSAILTWTVPTQYTDGTAIVSGDLKGFKVYRGNTIDGLSLLANLGANVTAYTDAGLLPGTYFYAVTAYTNNAESDRSGSANKTVLAVVLIPKNPTVTVK